MKTNPRLQRSERAYLLRVFELTEQIDRNGVPLAELEESLGLAESEGAKILETVVGEGMVVWPSKGMVMLTEQGLALFGNEPKDMHRVEQSFRHAMPRAQRRREAMPHPHPYGQPQAG